MCSLTVFSLLKFSFSDVSVFFCLSSEMLGLERMHGSSHVADSDRNYEDHPNAIVFDF